MRYTIIKSPITKKHYIWDSEEKKMSSEKGFDIILEIVQDKIAIVGRADFYQSGYYYSTYKYQLVDVKGRPESKGQVCVLIGPKLRPAFSSSTTYSFKK